MRNNKTNKNCGIGVAVVYGVSERKSFTEFQNRTLSINLFSELCPKLFSECGIFARVIQNRMRQGALSYFSNLCGNTRKAYS